MANGIDIYGNYILPAATGVKNAAVSLFKSDDAPGDYSSRKASLARQQKLADMLSQMGAQEQAVSTAGGIIAPMSPMGALARGLTSFGGSYLSGKAAADEAAANKAARAEAIEARKTFNQEPDLVMPGGSARLTPTPGGNGAIPASPELPKYILQDDEAMAAGPQRSDATLRPFDIMPKEQDVTFGDIISKVGNRSKEDQSRLLDEYEMSDNPYLQNLSQRLRAESKGEMFEGSKYGNFRMNADGTVEEIVPAIKEAGDTSDIAQLIAERNKLPVNDPNRAIYDAAINMKTTRAPTVQVNTGDRTDKVLSDVYANDLSDLRAKKNSAQSTLAIIKEIETIPAGQIYSGPTADLKTTVGSYLEAIGLGGVDNAKIANSQQYQAKIAELGISKLKGALGVNPTDRDLDYVKMTLPLLTKVPAARATLLNLLKSRANADIENYRSATTHYRKNNNLDEWSPPGSRTSTGVPTSGF